MKNIHSLIGEPRVWLAAGFAFVLIATYACAPSPRDMAKPGEDSEPRGGIYAGTYSFGFETSSFVPAGTKESWWVTGDLERIHAYDRSRPGGGYRNYPTYRARVRGELSPEGKYGHMGAYDRQLRVTEVLEFEPVDPPARP